MICVEIYIADDGTKFNTEEECMEYEDGLVFEELKDGLKMWDSDHKPLPCTPAGFESASYIKIQHEFKPILQEWVKKVYNEEVFSEPELIDENEICFYFNENYGQWTSWMVGYKEMIKETLMFALDKVELNIVNRI